jgi:hypothetical protein
LAADVLAADEVVLLSKPGRQTQSSALLAFVYSGVLEPSAQAVQFSVSCDRKKPAMHATHDSGSKASGVSLGRLRAWSLGRLQAWSPGRLQAWSLGRLQAWSLGRLQAWSPGRPQGK